MFHPKQAIILKFFKEIIVFLENVYRALRVETANLPV